MSIVSSNQNLYYVAEEFGDEDELHVELYPVIAFDIDIGYEQKIIALNLGEVEGTLFDLNQNIFISTNGIKKTPREYLQDYTKAGLTVYISTESQKFLGLTSKEKESPTQVSIVDSCQIDVGIIANYDK